MKLEQLHVIARLKAELRLLAPCAQLDVRLLARPYRFVFARDVRHEQQQITQFVLPFAQAGLHLLQLRADFAALLDQLFSLRRAGLAGLLRQHVTVVAKLFYLSKKRLHIAVLPEDRIEIEVHVLHVDRVSDSTGILNDEIHVQHGIILRRTRPSVQRTAASLDRPGNREPIHTVPSATVM